MGIKDVVTKLTTLENCFNAAETELKAKATEWGISNIDNSSLIDIVKRFPY